MISAIFVTEWTATFGDVVFSNLFNTFVEPSLKARILDGRLLDPYPISHLVGFQIIFYPDDSKPLVRINAEVKANVEVKPKPDVSFEEGDPVSFDQIESVGVITLTDDEADCGHATFLRTPDGWSGYFDFTYYRGTATGHLAVAEEFLYAAQACREARKWVAFADTLFSAAELAAKASLFCLDIDGAISKAKTHAAVKSRFNKQRHFGNVDTAHTSAFNRLWGLRQNGRYLENEITFEDADADQLLQDVRSLVVASRKRTRPLPK